MGVVSSLALAVFGHATTPEPGRSGKSMDSTGVGSIAHLSAGHVLASGRRSPQWETPSPQWRGPPLGALIPHRTPPPSKWHVHLVRALLGGDPRPVGRPLHRPRPLGP